LPLSQSYARTAAVLLDKFDARDFEGASYGLKCHSPRFMIASLEMTNGHNPHKSGVCQIGLAAAD
jgi:hypothetical protein